MAADYRTVDVIEDVPVFKPRPAEGWGAAHKVTGCAHAFVEFKYEQDKIVPYHNLRWKVRGYNRVYDPRDGSTGYSDNAALVAAAAWLNFVRGIGYSNGHLGAVDAATAQVALGTIDIDSLNAAANICDANGWTAHGALDLDTPAEQALRFFGAVMAGQIFFDGHAYRIRAGSKAAVQGRITGGLDSKGGFHRPGGDLFNSVGGSYRNDPARGRFEPTGYPDLEDADALRRDKGGPKRMTLDLPFCRSAAHCLQVASTALVLNRHGQQVEIGCRCATGCAICPATGWISRSARRCRCRGDS